jgi:hypothetical protein
VEGVGGEARTQLGGGHLKKAGKDEAARALGQSGK